MGVSSRAVYVFIITRRYIFTQTNGKPECSRVVNSPCSSSSSTSSTLGGGASSSIAAAAPPTDRRPGAAPVSSVCFAANAQRPARVWFARRCNRPRDLPTRTGRGRRRLGRPRRRRRRAAARARSGAVPQPQDAPEFGGRIDDASLSSVSCASTTSRPARFLEKMASYTRSPAPG